MIDDLTLWTQFNIKCFVQCAHKVLDPHRNQLGNVTLTDYGLKRIELKLRKILFFSFLNRIVSNSLCCTFVSHIGKSVVLEAGCSQSNTVHDFRFHPRLHIFHGTLLQEHEGIGCFHRIQNM